MFNESLTGSSDGVVLGSIYVVIAAVAVVSNTLILVVISKAKELHKLSLLLIAHMAFWDLVQGLHTLIFAVPSAFLGRFSYPEYVLGLAACSAIFLTGTSTLTTLSIVTDRFVSIKFPIQYRTLRTRVVLAGTVVGIILIATMRMSLVSFPDKDFSFVKEAYVAFPEINTGIDVVASSGFVVLTLLTVVALSCVIIHSVRKTRRTINLAAPRVPFIPRKMVRLSVMTLLSAGVYCLVHLPFFIGMIASFSLGQGVLRVLPKFVSVSFMSNSIWNMLIYTVNYKDFRQSLLRIFCRSYYQANMRTNNLPADVRKISVRPRVRTSDV